MKLPIRNKGQQPLTIFIEPICEEFEVPAGGEAIVTLQDGYPHSFDVFDEHWISIWDEGPQSAVVEISETQRSIGCPPE